MAVLLAWAMVGAIYGLMVALRMGLAGRAGDSLLLMAYVALFFALLGSFLFGLRAGIRGLLRVFSTRQMQEGRSFWIMAWASLGGAVLCLAVLAAGGDLLLTLAFRPDTSRWWLAVCDLLMLAGGVAHCWLLGGLWAQRLEKRRARTGQAIDGRLWLGFSGLMLAVVFLAPWLGAPSPRWSRARAPAPADLQPVDTGLQVLVFAVDGATWSVFDPLIQAGELATVADLVERGVRATPISPPPQVSPAIWTTVVTGRAPAEHGVREYLLVSLPGLVKFPFEALANDWGMVPFFFVGLSYFAAGLAEGIPPTSSQVRKKTFWHMLDDGDVPSLVLGWPCTWPAEPICGLTVSDRFGPNEFDLFSSPDRKLAAGIYPAAAEARLQKLMVDSGGDPGPMLGRLADMSAAEIEELSRYRVSPMLPSPLALLTTVYDADMSFLNFMQAELVRGPYRLSLVMLNGPDLAMHAFWPHRFPGDFGLRRSPQPAWGKLIDTYHALVDERIAQIVKTAGENTVVILLSDHGMAADPNSLTWKGNHAPEGLFVMAGGPVRQGLRIAKLSYLDIAPTILYLLGFPVAKDLPGRALTELLSEDFLARFPLRSIASYETEKLESRTRN